MTVLGAVFAPEGEVMHDPLTVKDDTPDDVLPYAPSWARAPGYRATQQNVSYDSFSDEENPSYRSMAQMFAPQPPPAKKPASPANRMLLRFGLVVGAAAAVLALFIGYVATKSGDEFAGTNAERFKGVNQAVAAIQAVLTPESGPAAPEPPAAETSVPASAIDRPVEAKLVPPADAKVSTDRGAAPEAAPVDTNLIPEPAAAAPLPEPQAPAPTEVAALPAREAPPAPPPEPIVPQLTAGELAILMSKGRRFVENGDFSSARPVYRRAAEAGYAEAALALGETYDPIALDEHGAVGMTADVKQARHWYERARDLGSLEAPTRLDRLPTN